MNKLILKGRTTKESDLRIASNGKGYCILSVAVDDRGNEDKPTDFFDIKCFGKTAEIVSKFVGKGQEILIEAKIKQNNYEKDGVKYYGYDFILDSFEFCGSAPKKEAQTEEATAEEQAPAEDTPF